MLKYITLLTAILISTPNTLQASPISYGVRCAFIPGCIYTLKYIYDTTEPEVLDSVLLMYRTFDLNQNPEAANYYLDRIEKNLERQGKLTPQIKARIKKLRENGK